MEIRERLSDLIKQKRWSQADLAAELGERRGWVNDRVTGRIAIKADEIPRLARALDVPCSAFFAGSDCPEVRPESRKEVLLQVPDERRMLGEVISRAVARWMEHAPPEHWKIVADFFQTFAGDGGQHGPDPRSDTTGNA